MTILLMKWFCSDLVEVVFTTVLLLWSSIILDKVLKNHSIVFNNIDLINSYLQLSKAYY